ncbi:MAG: hypothetical protein ABEJ42_07315 [Halobacteriaceae archaeon]
MGTRWQCTQCSTNTHTGLIKSVFGGGPDACESCGNEEFEEIQTTGVIHNSINDLIGYYKRFAPWA